MKTLKTISMTEEDASKIIDLLRDRGLVVTTVATTEAKPTSSKPGDELFSDFIKRFWDFETSPYIADRLSHGGGVSFFLYIDRG